MRKKMRVVQISGFRGLCMAIFVVTCLAAGFIAFPAIVAMNVWNWIANFVAIPVINMVQGLLLWAIIAISGFIINDRNKFLCAFSSKNQLSEAQVQRILENVKNQREILSKSEVSKEKEKENV